MARLILNGEQCDVRIFSPGEYDGEPANEEVYLAYCESHDLIVDRYDTLDDATEYAADHADGAR